MSFPHGSLLDLVVWAHAIFAGDTRSVEVLGWFGASDTPVSCALTVFTDPDGIVDRICTTVDGMVRGVAA